MPSFCNQKPELTHPEMCKYIQTHYIHCHCTYWTFKSYCSQAKPKKEACGLYPYPRNTVPEVFIEGRCEFCEEEAQESDSDSERARVREKRGFDGRVRDCEDEGFVQGLF